MLSEGCERSHVDTQSPHCPELVLLELVHAALQIILKNKLYLKCLERSSPIAVPLYTVAMLATQNTLLAVFETSKSDIVYVRMAIAS